MRTLYDITTLANIHCATGVDGAGIFRHVEQTGRALVRRSGIDVRLSTSPSQFGKGIRYVRETGRFSPHDLVAPLTGSDGIVGVGRFSHGLVDDGPVASSALDALVARYDPQRVVSAGRFDVWHLNWRGVSSMPTSVPASVVVTVPDVIALKRPELFVSRGERNPIGDYLDELLRSVRPEHDVIVSTEAVRSDVTNLFPHISEEQVHVVNLGVEARFGPDAASDTDIAEVRRRLGIPDGRYLLSVNTLEPRKNVTSTVAAFGELVRAGDDETTLVLAGSRGWLADDLEQRIQELRAEVGRRRVVVTGYVADDDLPALYAGAAVFAYPSFDEGFGLPVLEAMASGTPVVTSDVEVLREVSGGASLLVDPTDVGSLTKAIAEILDGPGTADDLRRRGLDHARRFTWGASAESVVAAYEAASQRRSRRQRARSAASTFDATSNQVRSAIVGSDGDLAMLRGLVDGGTVVVVGDALPGHALPLSLLACHVTIAVGDLDRSTHGRGWKPTMHVLAGSDLSGDRAREINGIAGTVILAESAFATELRHGPDVLRISLDDQARLEGTDVLDGAPGELVGEGRAGAAAIQMGLHLGFDRVLLVGLDDIGRDSSGVVQGVGTTRRWHQSAAGMVAGDGRVLNLSPSLLPNSWPRADMMSTLATELPLDFPRSQHATLDETEVIAWLLREDGGGTRTMIDVGAHRGTSARHFVNDDWQILCFEPDNDNRGHLERRLGDRPNISIDPRAVGSTRQESVPFFRSEESSGISGLSAFRDTHQQSDVVEMTTVTDIVEDLGLSRIDFLKIDVEGFDFDVLKGVPWDRLRPSVIECEYEDAKTLPMGHTIEDTAAYLHERGYAVYVSEWHPIVRYGIPHDWRRVVPYPGVPVPTNSWGNLLAFAHDPGFEAVQTAFERHMQHHDGPHEPDHLRGQQPEPAKVPPRPERDGRGGRSMSSEPPDTGRASHPPSTNRRWYADRADRLRDSNPALYRSLRLGRRVAKRLVSHPLMLTALLLVLAASVVLVLAAPTGQRLAAAGIAVAVLTAVACLAVSAYANHTAVRLQIEKERVQTVVGQMQALDRRSEEHREATKRIERLEERLRVSARERASVHAAVRELEQRQRDDADRSAAERARIEEIGERLLQIDQKMGELSTDLASATPRVEELERRRLLQVEQRVQADSSERGAVRMHARALSNEDVLHLRSNWLPTLGLHMTDRELRYEAYKISLLEDHCEGRLATTIQAAMLRSLALLSLGNERLQVLEIGTLHGIAACVLHASLTRRGRTGELTLVDPLAGYYGRSERDDQTGVPVDRATLEGNLQRAGISQRDVRIVEGLSADPDTVQEVGDRQYDFVLIDGDHSLAGVSSDFELYAPMVSPGGLLLFDDYDTEDWPAIGSFVDDVVRADPNWLWIGGGWRTGILKRRRESGT